MGLDCVFDVEGDDIEGNDAIIQVAEKYKNIVFAEKMLEDVYKRQLRSSAAVGTCYTST